MRKVKEVFNAEKIFLKELKKLKELKLKKSKE